jgi:hypothetical protein
MPYDPRGEGTARPTLVNDVVVFEKSWDPRVDLSIRSPELDVLVKGHQDVIVHLAFGV